MKKLILIVSLAFANSAVWGQTSDPIADGLLTSINTHVSVLDANTIAQNGWFSGTYAKAIEEAYNSASLVLQGINQVQYLYNSLQNQIKSLTELPTNVAQRTLNFLNDLDNKLQKVESTMGNTIYTFPTGFQAQLAAMIPSNTMAAQVNSSVASVQQAIQRLDGETDASYLQRKNAMLAQLSALWDTSTKMNAQIQAKLTAHAETILEGKSDTQQLLQMYQNQVTAPNGSILGQLQILNQQMSLLVSKFDDATQMQAQVVLQQQGMNEMAQKTQALSQAQAPAQPQITAPDQSTLQTAIDSSYYSADDLYGTGDN